MNVAMLKVFMLTAGMLCFYSTAVEAGDVKVSGRRILVDGEPYLIKGVCYHPVPKGSTDRKFANLTEDLALMKEAGVNTIRVYSPIDDKHVLDEIHSAGLKLIVGIGFNQAGYNDIWSGSFTNYINRYKGNDAILMWELGNECNYHPEWFGSLAGWYHALNHAAEIVHQIDPSHPVTTAHGELPDAMALSSCPNVDVWGLNIYRWDFPESVFPQWASESSKPMYLSEGGSDSYMTVARDGYKQGPNQKAQADADKKILDAVFRHQDICSGIALFSFADGWWKAGNPDVQDPGGSAPGGEGVPYDGVANEEYWGVVDLDRNRKAAFYAVEEIYKRLPDREPCP